MQPKIEATDDKPQTYKVNFVADVHLIRVLGEQLIGSEKVGILELIKNAYDAGASECHVWIEKVPGLPEAEPSNPQVAELPGPVITITDDGCGMDKDTIEQGWMRPATRIKTSVKERLKREREEADERGTRAEYEALVGELKREHGGRLPLGEKGVGRFAAHRLGRYLILRTKTKNEPHEWVLNIDWKDFDEPEDKPDEAPLDLNKVDLTLIRRPPGWDYGPTDSGTVLRIYGGREGFEWTDEKLLEIGHAIAHLSSPAKDKQPTGFDVIFHCPQLSEEIEVLTETVPAPFECIAVVDEQGKAEIEIRFVPPETLSKPLPAQTWTESVDLRIPPEGDPNYWLSPEDKSHRRLPVCGPFTVEIKLWIRRKEWIEYADWQEFRIYLDKFGGIGVYRDGLSILPAQIASRDDWLGLSKPHIKKGWNISYYQMWGSIDLLQEHTLGLVDRTSREGLLETRPFTDLRELLRPIIFALQFRVRETRDRYSRLKRGGRIPEAILNRQIRTASEILETVSWKYDFEVDPLGLKEVIEAPEKPKKTVLAIAETLDRVPQEFREVEAQADALLEAAGYGIAVGVAIHEIEKITSNIYFGLERLLKRSVSLGRDMRVETDRLGQTAKALLNELKRIAPLRVTRLERPKEFRVRDCVLAASGAFRLSWKGLGIKFYPPSESSDFKMMGSFGACSQVFANLFDNATYWLRTSDAEDRSIIVQMYPDERKVVVADGGPGIDAKIRPHLFEPFYSLKNPPSGLGLYICRYYMRQMKGTIRESHEREKLPGFPGAHFTLVFPGEDKKE